MNFDKRITAQGIKDWNEKVFNQEDVRIWHKVHTPWFNPLQIEQIIQFYDQQIIDIKDDEDLLNLRFNKKDLNEFQRLMITNNE